MTRLLGHPRLPAILAIAAIALTLPALATGLYVDDALHELALRGWPRFEWTGRSSWDLFTFAEGDPALTHRFMDVGVFPWWTDVRIHFAFLRPLSVVTHQIDHALFGRSAVLLHAHSLVWLGAMVLTAALLYRRLHGAGLPAALASVAFAIDDAHGFPAAWVANRNALLATTFGLASLHAYDRWRRDGWRPGAPIAVALFAAALLSGEAAVGVLAFFAAHALVLDPDRPVGRVLALAPFAAVLVAWRVVYVALGYGAIGSGYYLDPLTSPGPFARAVLERAPVLFLGQWAIAPTDVWVFLSPAARIATIVVALVVLAALAFGLRAAWREKTGRFFAIGMLLAIVPTCATFPMERLLLFVGFGAMGLLGVFLGAIAPERRSRALTVALVVVHFVVAPLLLPVRALSPALFGSIDENIASIPRPADIARRDVVALNAPEPYSVGFLPIVRALDGGAAPAHVRRLATSTVPLTVRRTDARTLVVRPDGGYLREPDADLVRDPRRPMREGEEVRLSGVTIRIGEVADGHPRDATFRFDRPLEDERFLWIAMGPDGFVPWRPPPIGASTRLAAYPPLGL